MPHIEIAINELAADVDWPEGSGDLATRVVARIGAKPQSRAIVSRRLAIGLSVLAIAVGSLVFSPRTRQAVADLFTAAGIQISFVADPLPPATADLDLGEQVTLTDAAARVDFSVHRPVGEPTDPDAVHLTEQGQVNMVWRDSETLPAAADTDVGILLSQGAIGTDEPLAYKLIGSGTAVENVLVGNDPGLWIEGAEHTITLFDLGGNEVPVATRLAANVLLWSADGVNYRLETTGDLDSALALADALEPIG